MVKLVHYKIMILANKKERNHYDLKKTENYCKTKNFPKSFPLKMDNYITKRAELSIRIDKFASFMISPKSQMILVTKKQWQLMLGEPQHTKKLQPVFF